MNTQENRKTKSLLDRYYQILAEFEHQYALHEGAASVAFQTLLAESAKPHHWNLIPQLASKGIRPDATLKDPMGLPGGYWEAKDTKDQLDGRNRQAKSQGLCPSTC